jgi:chorismate dehydratase
MPRAREAPSAASIHLGVERVQINWDLAQVSPPVRVCAVNFLNTVPLVWGMLKGPQKTLVDLSFELPAVCAEVVEERRADIGLVPVAEIARQALEIVPGFGISCRGPVRSILLICRVPIKQIRNLAVDSSSRTSIQLARVILRERYGVVPNLLRRPPVLENMLADADAALVIGDPALRIHPEELPYETLDLGAEWFALTRLPMVFAAWAGRPPLDLTKLSEILQGSYEFGMGHLEEIVDGEFERRGLTRELAHRYITSCIHYPLGPVEQQGLQTFLSLAGQFWKELDRQPDFVAS